MCGEFPLSALTQMQITPPNKLELFQSQLGCVALGTLLMVVQPAHVLAGPGTEPPRAAVFSDSLPGFNQALAREISGQVQAAGYSTEFISATVLTNQTALTAKRYNLLVLPGSRSLPMAAAAAIQGYLQEGGDLLALGLPAWQSPLFQVKGQWMSRQSLRGGNRRPTGATPDRGFRPCGLEALDSCVGWTGGTGGV